ncbi:Ig-like domain-containing protein [Marivirga lumbricoides]|uniref:Ig-like domain-containing protein n=1 Tax=Marivirga lumbricoides TaxID=1046115 RepID=UPI00166ABDDC
MKRIFLILFILISFYFIPNTVYGQRPPVKAGFTENPSIGCELPHTVFFTDLSENPDIWLWNFGDGSTSTSKNPIHTYNSTGSFNVHLFVQDTINGDSDEIFRSVNIGVTTVDFKASEVFPYGCGPLSVNFIDESTITGPGTITDWLWDFGDGSTSTVQNPLHIYEKPRRYTVTLTVTSSLGCTNSITKTNFVQVVGPDVNFTASHTGATYSFTHDTRFESPPLTWSWDFGDGSTSSSVNPTHTYATQGVFDVSLTVRDLDGCSRTHTKTNFVNTISGAFDVSNAIFAGDEDRLMINNEASPSSLAFNTNGTIMFVLGADQRSIKQYTLSVAFDISTAVYDGIGESFLVAEETTPRSLAFNKDGTRMFVLGSKVNEYNLSNAFDVSTAIYAGDGEAFLVSAQETNTRSLAFNPDGTKMFVMGADGDDINEYHLSTGFDVSTAVFAGDTERFSVSAQVNDPTSLAFNTDGTKMFVLGMQNKEINEYMLLTPFDVSTANYAGDAERFSVASEENIPTTLAFNNDGTKMFVLGQSGNREISEYSLAAPVITNAVANQTVNDTTTISPFSTITVQDPNGDNVSATITLDDNAKGILTGAGLTGTGPYTLASTDAASLQSSLRALVFSPTENRGAISETTIFTLAINDNIYSDTDNITTVVSNAVAPSVVISSGATEPVNGAFTITITFSEAVTGFELGDITVGNGTASAFASTSASIYTALITPATDGAVTIDIAETVAQDAGGTDNTEATQLSINADVSPPGVLITSSVVNTTNGAFTTTFTFSEAVTGFSAGDITLSNASASNFKATSALVYTADIMPTTDGTITIDVKGDVAEDAAGNGNLAATQFKVEADFTPPTVTITSSTGSLTNAPFMATFTFSEAVTGFAAGDITLSNATVSNFVSVSDLVYTAGIEPVADGTVTINVPANVAQDDATNGNTAAIQFSILYDSADPAVAITSSLNISTNQNPIPVTITFSEEVVDFILSDINVGNGNATNFSTSDNIVFTINIIPTTDGMITVDIPAAVARDAAGNDNQQAATFSIAYDSKVDQVICQNITVQLDANGAATIQANQLDNGSSDNFGIASRSINITSLNCSHLGDNNVTLTITDNNGNVGSCIAIVTVEDNISPTVSTQDITVPLDVNGKATITPADIDNGSTDNCAIASRTLDVSNFDTPKAESITVTLTVTDNSGNSNSGTAIVTFGKVAQNIIFEPIPDKKVGEDPVILRATGGESGLPVIFSMATEPSSGVASLVDGTIIIEGPGSVTVTASQAGNDIFLPAEEISQTFQIISNNIFLPTLFTPNNDQTNDRFILRGGGNVATILFQIFDRDGNSVFISQSVTELFQSGWDGTSEGKEQPQGAYIWVIKGSFQDGSPLLINGKNTGIIKLVR